MADLYSRLPTRSYTLGLFNQEARRLHSNFHNENMEPFLRFMLTGDAGDHQAIVDPIQNTLQENDSIKVSRDFDSAIGIAENVVVLSSISVYPVPNPADVLTTSIHLTYTVGEGERQRDIPIHLIPNFQLGFWDQRHMIHVLFPLLASEGRPGPQLSRPEKTEFYEKVLRPAISELLPQDVGDWPPDYESEMFRAQKRTGRFSYQSKMLPAWAVPTLGDQLRSAIELNDVHWARGFVFLHTIRGTKHGTQHSTRVEAAAEALDEYLKEAKLPYHIVEDSRWWIDIGLEFTSDQQTCLQWTTLSHPHIVRHFLRIRSEHAERVTRIGSSKYARDIVSHLPAVSGCRIEPGVQAEGPYQAAYFQMYTTDKSLTYNPEGGHHGKAITMEAAMGQTQPAKFMEGLLRLYLSASEKNSSNARVEVRVPMEHAMSALLRINNQLIRRSLLGFTRLDWWNFRAWRALALSCTLTTQAEGPPVLRVRPEALLLTAACVWLANGLHARPDDGPAWRSLMQAVLPLRDPDGVDPNVLAYPMSYRGRREAEEEEEEEGSDDDDSSAPHNPFGVIFLRRVRMQGEVPRMRAGGPFLTLPAFKYIFGGSLDEINRKYYKVGIVPREVIQKRRVTNKMRSTPTYIDLTGEAEPVIFNLAASGHKLPPPAVDSGSDMEVDVEDDQGEVGGIDAQVTHLWRQFLLDVAAKSPNARGATNPSYLTASKVTRLSGKEDLYMINKLSDIFIACAYKVGDFEDWKRAFDHLFPPRGEETSGSVQNYTNCQYYLKWKRIAENAEPATVSAIRREIWKKLFKLAWIPHACQDKMWVTSQKKGFIRLPPGTAGPAPRLIVKSEPEWE